MHVALTEVGAIYASAYTHTGWDTLLAHRRSPVPTSIDDIPVLPAGKGARDQGHAACGGQRSGQARAWGGRRHPADSRTRRTAAK